MPELPDIETYLACLRPRIGGQPLQQVRLASPFLLRSVSPPLSEAHGRKVVGLRRLGKRIVLELDEELFLVLHLMIAGRLHWREPGAPIQARGALAAFDFEAGALVLTEAGARRKASLHVVAGKTELAGHDPGGLELAQASVEDLTAALTATNHTLERALTDPRIISGVGNAYSDEILHRARLSPFKQTRSLDRPELERLHEAARALLDEWTRRLIAEVSDGFPRKVTAFRPEFAVHGRHRKPCPLCGAPVQRIVYARKESNYCARCQTGGRVLADRSLSRLLKADWPRSIEELEARC